MKKILFIALAITTIISCKKKDDENAQIDVTTANLAGTWKVTALTQTVGTNTTDEFAALDACEKDDITVIVAKSATTGTTTNSEGATSCNPPKTTTTDNFTFDATNKTMTSNGITATITSLTQKNLVTKIVFTFAGSTTTIISTLTR